MHGGHEEVALEHGADDDGGFADESALLVSGQRDRIRDAPGDPSPSRTKKNSRYSMTNRLTIKSAVPLPIPRAWAAMNELPFMRAADSLSFIAPRLVSPKRSSRSVAHAGNASGTC